jgi:ribosomal protein S18 acetylase RimI-like enzyme
MTIDIRPLTALDPVAFRRLVSGYTAHTRYQIEQVETEEQILFRLDLVSRSQPFVKQYDHLDEETIQRYANLITAGYAWGAYLGAEMIGLLLAEPYWWNQSLCVWEFHVATTHRRQGIGQRLMERVAAQAKAAGLRTIVCETQTTNTPSIFAYRKMGFRLEGVDLSYYSNADYPDGEVAVFMKRRL